MQLGPSTAGRNDAHMPQVTRGVGLTPPHPWSVTVVVHPNVPTVACQEWQSLEIVHWVAALHAALGSIFWERVKIHPLDDAALVGARVGFGA